VDGLWSPLTSFSTLRKPTITGPIGIDNADPNLPPTVTDLRPTITWTAIDGAARYDIRVDRASSTGVYLQTTSATNSYRFEISILAGNYTVQVRAVSRTGELSEWSNTYSFTATAGASVIRSAAVISGQRARILWEGVAEAATYEVQIAWIGVNFDFIHPTGLLTTSYTTTAGLAPGNYRVWVRAIMADGTRLSWSNPADFTVVDAELPKSDELQLTALLPPASTRKDQTDRAAQANRSESKIVTAESAHATPVVFAEVHETATGKSAPVMSPAAVLDAAELNDAELIQMLAEACLHQEWWTTSEGTST
jgi:predicted phage tail protein